MTKPTLTPKSFLKTLTILHFSFFGAMLFFAGVAYFINQNHTVDINKVEIINLMILVVIGLVGVFGGQLAQKKNLEKAKNQSSLRHKLGIYQTSALIKYAFLEGPALFAIVLYLQSSEFIYLLFAVILMIYFITLRPTKEKIIKSLQLGREHQMQFNKENQELN